MSWLRLTVKGPVMRAVAGLVGAALGFVAPALGQPEHPNHRRGLQTPTAYNYDQLDAVNLFSGNLSVVIPITEFRVGGDLTLPLAAHYNSNVWGFEGAPEASLPPHEPTTTARVDLIHNAGVGWLVTFGKMWPPNTPPQNDTPGWLLVEPDGTRRHFVERLHIEDPEDALPDVTYTTDGSFLRRRLENARWHVESPNGLVREFSWITGDLQRVRDRFGNQIDITYGTNQWILTDNALPSGRTHTIDFHPPSGELPARVQRVNLASGAVYDFAYHTDPGNPANPLTIPRHIKHTSHNAPFGGLPATVDVFLLKQITVPAGAGNFRMEYHLDNVVDPGQGIFNPSGLLRRLDLPTRGRLEWDYTPWTMATSGSPFPEQDWHLDADGVRFKRIYAMNGALEGRWEYTSGIGGGPRWDGSVPATFAREKRTIVSNPLGQVTIHYFTSHPDSWLHGLPFSEEYPDGALWPGNFFVTRQVFSGAPATATFVRSEWSRFVADRLVALSNQRLEASRTLYHDDDEDDEDPDNEDNNPRWRGVDYSDYDGLGHYRVATTSASANFAGGGPRTTFTAFNRGGAGHNSGNYPGSFNRWPADRPWIIGTFEVQKESEGSLTAARSFVVDPATGWVSSTRIHRFSSPAPPSTVVTINPNDVIVETTHDAGGNLGSERSYGGDTQTVPAASPTYRIDHTTLWGTRATSTYMSGGSPLTFKTLDCDIQASTGLPTRCRDSSLIGTNFEYDLLGRLRWEKPDSGHDGWTEYVHTAASTLEPASVAMRRRPNGGGATLAESSMSFDGFGRVFEERQKMADGTFSTRRTLYNAMGWKTEASEQGNVSQTTRFLNYDPFGRPMRIRPPDSVGTNTLHDINIDYDGVRKVERTVNVATAAGGAESISKTTEIYDQQGRLFQVMEPASVNDTTTTYTYDVGNRLVQVQQAGGANTQTRSFNYDLRGFLLSEQHPEKGGLVTYSNYDARGHAGRKQDGPFDLTFQYDAAERLVLIRESGAGFNNCTNDNGHRCLKTFTYGTSNAANVRTNGRLLEAARYNYPGAPFQNVRLVETYTYGGRQGRVSRRETIGTYGTSPIESYAQTWTYDPLGNVKDLGYPDCFAGPSCTGSIPRTVSPSRSNGFVTAIPGFATSISYYPNGLYRRINHANGVVDEQTNDPNGMRRPGELFSQRAGTDLWRSGVYEYDGAGNVEKIGGSSFIYDRVRRVVEARVRTGPTGSGPLLTQTYSYDPFGNLLGLVPGRNTPTSPANNRLDSAAYDTAGNLTVLQGSSCGSPGSTACFEYDAFGMMTRHRHLGTGQDARFIYTPDDERFWTHVVGVGATFTLRDLDGKVLREYSGGFSAPKDYVHREGQLLASVWNNNPEGQRHFHLDHLGTPRLVTSLSGGNTGGVWTGATGSCVPAAGDYNGDGRAEFSQKCGPSWHFYNDNGSYLKGIWTGGQTSDIPVPADYDGDGDDDVVAFNGGAWHFYDYATGAYHGVWTGAPGACTPAPADYDGDGNADLSLKCGPSWHFYNDNGSYLKGIGTGGPDTELPVPGDYDGDGDDDVVAFNAGAWNFYSYATGAFTGTVTTTGTGTLRPAPMDYDGDGTTDLTVYAGGAWRFYADNGTFIQGIWTGGVAGDLPVPRNYQGGPPDEIVIFRGGAWQFFSFGGAVVAYHVYFPFGEEIEPIAQDGERMKFTGHQRDLNGAGGDDPQADDLDYMHARYYNPQLGRFLSTDPINSSKPGAPQTLNRYAYSRNNPINYVDPDGMAETVALAFYEADERALLRGDITGEEFKARNTARFQGVVTGLSFYLPGPEDVAFGIVAGTRLGSSLVGRLGGLVDDAIGALRLRSFTRGNFRENLTRLTGRAVDGAEAHHVFPHALRERFRQLGIDVNDPRFGAWWSKDAHRKLAHEYQRRWEAFLRTNPSKDQALSFGEELAREFGFAWNHVP